MQHYDVDDEEDEQNIYEAPCEDDADYGVIYAEPPKAVEKIYEMFEGKRLLKLCHQNIRYHITVYIIKLHTSCQLLTFHRILEELGSGEFGVVTRGMLSSTTGDVEVAVKMLNTDASDKDRLRFLQEAAIMCQFDHQNVIKLHGVVTEAPTMIVLEYVARGDLKGFLTNLESL